MKRNKLGQFLPQPIKVGDYVCSVRDEWNPGITYMKGYRVIATNLSSGNNKVNMHETSITSDNEFMIMDDDGDKRIFELGKSMFQSWEKLPNKPTRRLRHV